MQCIPFCGNKILANLINNRSTLLTEQNVEQQFFILLESGDKRTFYLTKKSTTKYGFFNSVDQQFLHYNYRLD